MSDSSDIWDISRSVLSVGNTQEKEIRYISHEKSNYGPLSPSILFKVSSTGMPYYYGSSDMKDADYQYQRAAQRPNAGSQIRDECKKAVIDYLNENGGKVPTNDLEEYLKAIGYSSSGIRKAKTDLQEEGHIRLFPKGFSPKVWYVSLTDLS